MHRNAPLHQKFRLLDKAIRPNLLWAAEARRPTVVGLRRVRTVFRQMARLVQPMHRRANEHVWNWRIRHTQFIEQCWQQAGLESWERCWARNYWTWA
eukprot:6561155-Alexandrium_andersonii.AAC.1